MKMTITPDHESVEGTRIKDNAFRGRDDIEEVVIGKGITEIGKDAFLQCGALRKVVLPEGLTHINDEAFHECPNLRTVNLPESLEFIGLDAFSDGGELDLYRTPRGVRHMREDVFHKGCHAYCSLPGDRSFREWSPCAGVARNMEIALHETGHFVALCAAGLYDEFTLATDQPTKYGAVRVFGLTERSGESLMTYSHELCAVAQKLAADPGALQDKSVRETFGKAADVCLPHVCFFLGGGVIDDCFGTGSDERNRIDREHVKNEILATMRLPGDEGLVRQMEEMVNGFLREVFYREFESVAKIARLLKERGTIDKRGMDGALGEDLERIRRNAEAEYAKLRVAFREWWQGKVAPLS